MASAATVGLSRGGHVLFGSLTASTFILGVWQTQRYFEKQQLSKARESQLLLPPVQVVSPRLLTDLEPFQRIQLHGKFAHEHELLVGPRGLPPGALPQAASRKQVGVVPSGQANSGPQGYLVVTPLVLHQDGHPHDNDRVVLVNRGWIPKEFIDKTESTKGLWDRPTGPVDVLAISSPLEQPKWLVPFNLDSAKPLLFMDRKVLSQVVQQVQQQGKQLNHQNSTANDNNNKQDEQDVQLVTQIKPDNNNADKLQFPLQPPKDHVGEYKLSPMIHAGYATTWFGLATAGVYMTRKLITRGR